MNDNLIQKIEKNIKHVWMRIKGTKGKKRFFWITFYFFVISMIVVYFEIPSKIYNLIPKQEKEIVPMKEVADNLIETHDNEKSIIPIISGDHNEIHIEVSETKKKQEPVQTTTISSKRINILRKFQVNGKGGMLGQTCHSGDEIVLSYETDVNCHILLLSVANNDIVDLFNANFKSQFTDRKIDRSLTLDNEVGEEIFYFIAAHDSINYIKDIQPRLLEVQLKHGKGVDRSHELYLPDNTYYNVIYLNHAE
jgi:hypothetical protein